MADSFHLDAEGLRELNRDLRKANAGAAGNFRKGFKQAGEVVASEARQRAAGFSTRIPASIKTSGTQTGVTVKAGGDKAPHAAIYERGGRHPVFGHRAAWIAVSGRHYMGGALDSRIGDVQRLMLEALDAITSDAGFH